MIVRAGGGAEPGLQLASPRDGAERGSQVSFSHPHGYAIMQALIHEGVIGDFRAPDIIRYAATASPASCLQPAGLSGVCVARRFGFTPLYTQFADVWKAVDVLHSILSTGSWDTPHVKSPIPLSFADSPQIPAIVCQLSIILTSNSCGQMRKRQRVT